MLPTIVIWRVNFVMDDCKSNVVAIIPARSGSKGVANKNIRLCGGKPLIAHSIIQALSAKTVDRVIVSTDSEEYADIARQYGAQTPFLRPKAFSTDLSLDIEVFEHALRFLKEEGSFPDIVVHLRPTHPIRAEDQIDQMVDMLRRNKEATSVRSVSPTSLTPYKMWLVDEFDVMSPVASCAIHEAYNSPRQLLPAVYMQNACVDVVRSGVITNEHSMTGTRILAYRQKIDFDIDTEESFIRADLYLELEEKLRYGKKLTFCFDIDGVIAYKTPGNNYAEALPNQYVINMLHLLNAKGHEIVLHTARGSSTGINWREITTKQLKDWGIDYSGLTFSKPAADIYVDDRFLTLEEIKHLL